MTFCCHGRGLYNWKGPFKWIEMKQAVPPKSLQVKSGPSTESELSTESTSTEQIKCTGHWQHPLFAIKVLKSTEAFLHFISCFFPRDLRYNFFLNDLCSTLAKYQSNKPFLPRSDRMEAQTSPGRIKYHKYLINEPELVRCFLYHGDEAFQYWVPFQIQRYIVS